MNFVYLEAIARDVANQTADSRFIAHWAGRIEPRRIPRDTLAAAISFVHCFESDQKPSAWMIPPKKGNK